MLHFLLLIIYSITLFYLFLFCVDDCNVNTHTKFLFTLIPFLISFPLLHFLFIFFDSITSFHFLFVLCRPLQCGHSCQYFVSTLISFLIHFPLLHFLFIFFYSITLFFFIFVLCWRLQCQHSCQYFVWTLISFLISFSVFSFSISIFVFNNFILYYFCCCVDDCNINTHANILFELYFILFLVWFGFVLFCFIPILSEIFFFLLLLFLFLLFSMGLSLSLQSKSWPKGWTLKWVSCTTTTTHPPQTF